MDNKRQILQWFATFMDENIYDITPEDLERLRTVFMWVLRKS